jgi:thioredoxin reductase (NADPH)
MADARSAPVVASRSDHIFPTLTPAQLARIAAHGRSRVVSAGEILIETGDHVVPFFVVSAGEVEIVQPSRAGDTLITVHGPGQFTGEVNMISGRRALLRARVRTSGRVLQLTREEMTALIQTDAELSEILMRAFILRRVELVMAGLGDTVVIGSSHSAATLRVKEFLTRNGHPYAYVDLDREADVQELLDRFQVGISDIPVLICRGQLALRPDEAPAASDSTTRSISRTCRTS